MEIHDNRSKTSPVSEALHRMGRRKIFWILVFLICLAGFGFGCIVYGGYLNKTRQNIKIGKLIISLTDFDFSFIPNKISSVPAEIERMDIDVSFVEFEQIRYNRTLALQRGRLLEEHQVEVPARIRYNNEEYRVDISLTGSTDMHFCHPTKWSYNVRVKDGRTIKGMRSFAILVPRSRGYLTDWIGTRLVESRGMIGLRSEFMDVGINGDPMGVYYLEERYDKRLVENNSRREGLIFKIPEGELDVYGLAKIRESEELQAQYVQLKKLWYGFLNGQIEAEEFFDLEKLATFAVVTDIMNYKHALLFYNVRFYFNPITGLCEPIGREWGYLQEAFENRFISLFQNQTSLLIERPDPRAEYHEFVMDDPVYQRIINLSFKEHYIKEAAILSDQDYLDSVINADNSLNVLLKKVHKDNAFYTFPMDELHKNQAFIRSKIFPQYPMIETYLESITDDSIFVYVENLTDLPVEIHYMDYNARMYHMASNTPLIEPAFESGEDRQLVGFPINMEIDLDFLSSDSLDIYYSLLGLDNIKSTLVFPRKMTGEDFAGLNYARQAANIESFEFLKINHTDRTIEFSAGRYDISRDLVIPEGYTVSALAGSHINLTNSARIISYSPVSFFGKSDNIIAVTSSDSTGQGIVVYNCKRTSHLSHVHFMNLSNISDAGWELRGAVTFYESPVNIDHCIFSDNLRGDDYLNIIGTDFTILDTRFENIIADAFDSDFCTGTMTNTSFMKLGNDAIDVSGTELKMEGIRITGAGDKGISGGEASHLMCENIIISGGEIAVASKDNSTIEIDSILIDSSKLAYCAFQKKPEFGPGTIRTNRAAFKDVKTEYLIETGSSLTINGKEIKNKSDTVEALLGGVEYGTASEH